jgi:hypothetical protein
MSIKTQFTKAVKVRETEMQVSYDFSFNGRPKSWIYKDEWDVDIDSVNGIHWTNLKSAFIGDVIDAVLWHEHKGRKEALENKMEESDEMMSDESRGG